MWCVFHHIKLTPSRTDEFDNLELYEARQLVELSLKTKESLKAEARHPSVLNISLALLELLPALREQEWETVVMGNERFFFHSRGGLTQKGKLIYSSNTLR